MSSTSTKTDPTTTNADDTDNQSVPITVIVISFILALIALFVAYRSNGNQMPGILSILASILMAPLYIIYKLIFDWNAVINGGVKAAASPSTFS